MTTIPIHAVAAGEEKHPKETHILEITVNRMFF